MRRNVKREGVKMKIREAVFNDLTALGELLAELQPSDVPPEKDALLRVWNEILADGHYHVLLLEEEGRVVSSLCLIVIPNLTRGPRPYALIENVVTRADSRRKGYAGALIRRAVELASENNCYKVMLLTGRKDDATLRFYENCGFNRNDKTGFIRWL